MGLDDKIRNKAEEAKGKAKERYGEMTDNERRAYATGAINGMLVAPFFGAPEDNVNWLKSCTAKLSDEDIAGMLTRYIRDNESQSNFNLNVLTFNAMRNACPKTK